MSAAEADSLIRPIGGVARLPHAPMSNPRTGAPSFFARAGLAVARGLVGGRFTRGLAEFRSTLAMSADELRARQQARTRAIVAHAITRVPFWRDAARSLGMRASDVRGVEDLVRLPVVDKRVFRSQPLEHFLAEGIEEHRRIPYRTSGSTGDPFTFVLDRKAMPIVFASHLFFDSIYGLDPFDRSVRVQGPPAAEPPMPAGMPWRARLRARTTRWLQLRYERTTLRRVVTLEATPERLRALIDGFAPVYLLGYTSTLAVLAEHLLADGWRPRRPLRAVITIAETLTPERRRVLEQCFAAPIANRYGQREFKFWSAQSPPGDPTSFVVHTDLVVFETLRGDGSPCAEDECGRVVMTNLHNEVMPFLRYDSGDLATRREPHGACPFPVMGRLEGRTQEVIRLASGKVLDASTVGHVLFVVRGHADTVRLYQVVQEAQDRLRLRVVLRHGRDDALLQRVRDDLAAIAGPGVAVFAEHADDIPLERSGKRPVLKALHIDRDAAHVR